MKTELMPDRRKFCYNAFLLASVPSLDRQYFVQAVAPKGERAEQEEYLVVNGWVLTSSDAQGRTDDVF